MWGPVNGETAALGWPRSHLKRVQKKKKKQWTQRQSQTGSFMLLFPPFYLLFLFSFSPFLSTTSTLLPPPLSFLSPALSPHLLLSGGALPDRTPFHAMYCSVGCLPSPPSPGMLAWHCCTGRGPGLCSLCSGQLAEQLKVKHLGLCNQRHAVF